MSNRPYIRVLSFLLAVITVLSSVSAFRIFADGNSAEEFIQYVGSEIRETESDTEDALSEPEEPGAPDEPDEPEEEDISAIFSYGDGSEDNPFVIDTAVQLCAAPATTSRQGMRKSVSTEHPSFRISHQSAPI